VHVCVFVFVCVVWHARDYRRQKTFGNKLIPNLAVRDEAFPVKTLSDEALL
jgi:hypothetical protein